MLPPDERRLPMRRIASDAVDLDQYGIAATPCKGEECTMPRRRRPRSRRI
jgi:hypothetical protein